MTASYPGRFVKEIDAQHTVLVLLDPWEDSNRVDKQPGMLEGQLRMGVARRDVNETIRDVINERVGLLFGTAQEYPVMFFDREKTAVGIGSTQWPRDEIVAHLDDIVGRLIVEGPSLSFVQAHIAASYSHPKAKWMTRQQVMAERLLEGWTDADQQEHIGFYRADIDQSENPEHIARVEGVIGRIEAFAAAHPNGIDRELTD